MVDAPRTSRIGSTAASSDARSPGRAERLASRDDRHQSLSTIDRLEVAADSGTGVTFVGSSMTGGGDP